MVDTWATVGSCAQIGKNCHLSGGVGIGGVLEPLQANPVIIEDNCFIGARSEVVEGVIVGTGAVLSMGVFISATTKVVDRATGQIHIGKVPPYSVVVPGNIGGGPDRPVDLLRGDREDGRRAHPLQDLDQRAAARLARSRSWSNRPWRESTESTRVHSGVDRLDADGTRVSGQEFHESTDTPPP